MTERPPSDSTTTVATDADLERGMDWQKPQAGLSVIDSQQQEEKSASADPTEKPRQDVSQDPDIVDWDGPDDPQNPQNWPENKKWMNIALISGMTLVTCVVRLPLVLLSHS